MKRTYGGWRLPLLFAAAILAGCGGSGGGTTGGGGAGSGAGGGGGSGGGTSAGLTERFAAPIDLGPDFPERIGKSVITGEADNVQKPPVIVHFSTPVVWPVGPGPAIAPISVPSLDLINVLNGTLDVNEQDQVLLNDRSGSHILTNTTSGSPTARSLNVPAGLQGGAADISDSGVAVGSAISADFSSSTPMFWPAGQNSPVAMAPLPGDTHADPAAVSVQGVVLGISVHNGSRVSVFWPRLAAGQAPSLLVLPGTSTPVTGILLSSNSQVVATYGTVSSPGHVVTWNLAQASPTPVELVGLGGVTLAHGINGSGVIVGETGNFIGPSGTPFAAGVSHGFLWDPTVNAMADLNALIPANTGWTLQGASAINDAGMIVGVGILNGSLHGFLLLPASNRAPAPAHPHNRPNA